MFVIPRETWRNLLVDEEEVWQLLLPVTLRNARFIGSMFSGLDDEIILQRFTDRYFPSQFLKTEKSR